MSETEPPKRLLPGDFGIETPGYSPILSDPPLRPGVPILLDRDEDGDLCEYMFFFVGVTGTLLLEGDELPDARTVGDEERSFDIAACA